MDLKIEPPAAANPQPEWTVLPPQRLPEPGAAPAALALAITFLVWGLVTSLIITGVGIALFAVAMGGWIRDLRHERNKH